MVHKTEEYACDNCGKNLPTCNNSLEIVTSKSERSVGWSRLHVVIQHRHGSHNDGETDNADLCKKCAVKLLTDALQRVKDGERTTKGAETSDQGNWES
jgi:protein-arginine kinase activator protein McsA